jgi:ribosomal protein S20
MNSNTRKQVVATLLQQGRRDLAEKVIKAGPYRQPKRVSTNFKKALKAVDQGYTNMVQASALLQSLGDEKDAPQLFQQAWLSSNKAAREIDKLAKLLRSVVQEFST